MATGIRELHRQGFGHFPAHIVEAPGRVELLGWVTVSHDGLALTATIDRYVQVSVSPRRDGKVEMVNEEGRRECFWLHELNAPSGEPFVDRAKALLRQLQRKRVHFSGFNAVIHDAIPRGLGLGEGAAADVALALAVRQLSPFTLTELGAGLPPRRDDRGRIPSLTPDEKRLLARWCQAAREPSENCVTGRLDPLPSLLGRAWHATGVDCRFQTVDHYSLIGEALVFCDSGSSWPQDAELTNDDYARECAAAAKALQAKSLRSVEMSYLKANRSRLTDRQYGCAYHIVGEIQRVVFAEKALREEDHRQAGYFLSLSHDSSREHWRAVCPEAELLVELASSTPGCLGARVTEPSGGRATLSLVAYHQVVEFVETLTERFAQETGRRIQPIVLQPVDGAG